MATVFLANEALWQALIARIEKARHVDAAIAYFGQGGAKQLPLKTGARLVVDMSPRTVRSGGTDPHEIEKLIQRGVRVFTRRHLHAKVVIADHCAIVGSANVSKYSYGTLDEAALLTTDRYIVERTREFVEALCTEPVRSKYLKACKKMYQRPTRPPFGGSRAKRSAPRYRPAKLWIVNISEKGLPEKEHALYDAIKRRARKGIRRVARSKLESFWWPYKPQMAEELELGDWIIQVFKHHDGQVRVYAPGQFLLLDRYVRRRGPTRMRYVFALEIPKRGQSYSWRAFRQAAKSALRPGQLRTPRTSAIRDPLVADGLLRLWTPAGAIAKR